MKNSAKLGKISSECEIANISPFGVWVLVDSNEYFLNHKTYPWFRGAAVEDVLNVESPRKGHLRWPELDIDLHVDALIHPERYPLTAKAKPHNKNVERTAKRGRSH